MQVRSCRLSAAVLACVASICAGSWAGAQQAVQVQGEEDRYNKIVDSFIQFDIGELRGREGQKANSRFRALRAEEAIPALVRGVNRAARLRQSCPIVVVSGKLMELIRSTRDREKLRHVLKAVDLSGSGVHYRGYLNKVREAAEARIAQLEGRGPVVHRQLRGGTPGQLQRSRIPIEKWSYDDLEKAIGEDAGTQLISVLAELEGRKGSEYTDLLAEAIATLEDEPKAVAQGLLAKRLTRMSKRTLQAKLRHPSHEIRAAAVRAIGYKGLPMYRELAAAVRDQNPWVAEHAHAVLVKLSGEDFGPPAAASAMQWYDASKRWEEWAQRPGGSNGSGR